MTNLQQLMVISLGVAVFVCTFELIRRRKILEKYALLWFLSGLVVTVLGLFPSVLFTISNLLGLSHLTTILFIAFIFLLTIVMHFTIVLSNRAKRETILAQEFSILTSKMKELEKTLERNTEVTVGNSDEISISPENKKRLINNIDELSSRSKTNQTIAKL